VEEGEKRKSQKIEKAKRLASKARPKHQRGNKISTHFAHFVPSPETPKRNEYIYSETEGKKNMKAASRP